MEIKGRQRGTPGEIARLKKNNAPESQPYANEALAELKEVPRNIPPPK